MSLYVHRDSASLTSRMTDNMSQISRVFEFDSNVFSTGVYERAFRGSVRDLLRRRQQTLRAYPFIPSTTRSIRPPKGLTNLCHQTATTANLLLLPNELIQHIASLLPCSSALDLLRVNRQLHTTCNDRAIFHNIAKYNLEQPMLSKNGLELPESFWFECDSVLATVPLRETIRVAYAAERCIKTLLKKGDSWTLQKSKDSKTYEISRWLPHMMALHHPAASQLKPEIFLELQGLLQIQHRLPTASPPQRRLLDLLGVNFILSYTILAQLHMTENGKQVKAPFDRFFSVNHIMDPPITLSNGVRTDGDAIKSLRKRVRHYGRFGKTQADSFGLDQATTLLPTLLLELAVHHLTPGQMSELPSPTKIPFHSFMHLPPIFDTNPSSVHQKDHVPFGRCHIRETTTPTFLSSGKWMGYYSDQRWALGMRRFDAPMRDIQLVARHPTKEEVEAEPLCSKFTILDSQSRGVDAIGEFSLQGRVRRVDGYVSLTKRYVSKNFAWSWEAGMTPFGMVGAWGGDDDRVGGYFWLWKEEWR